MRCYYFFLVFGILLFASALEADPNSLRFATEATYPPYENMDANGKIYGLDVDIMNALCQEMHKKCTIQHAPWDSLIPSLQLKKYDAIIAAMAITTERQKQVAFSDPYFTPTASFVGAKNIQLSDLNHKIIGVQTATPFIKYIQHFYPKAQIKQYPSIQSAFLDLQANRVEVVLGDTPVMKYWLQQKNITSFSLLGPPIKNPTYFGIGNGIAIRKNNEVLLKQLNSALAQIQKKGVYQAILHKYL